jgi:hypothetical protein
LKNTQKNESQQMIRQWRLKNGEQNIRRVRFDRYKWRYELKFRIAKIASIFTAEVLAIGEIL